MSIKTNIAAVRDLLNKESIYTWMLSFVLLFNAALIWVDKLPSLNKGTLPKEEEQEFQDGQTKIIPDEASLKALEKNKPARNLLNALFLAGFLIFSLGLFLDLHILMAKLTKRELIRPSLGHLEPHWGIVDVFKLTIIFLFWGHILHLIEGFIFSAVAEKKNLLPIMPFLNTGIMDLLILGFIFYFVKVKYSQGLAALGLKIKNMGRLISLGILSYISFLPILLFLLLLLIIFAYLFNYHPAQPIWFKIFLQEKRTSSLIYLTILVVIFGPIVEEIFFRGFAYSAFKRKWGVTPAMALSAVIFAGLHTNLMGFFPIMTLGFLFAYVYEKTGSLIPAIAIHMLHNGMMVGSLFLSKYLFNLVH